MQLCMLAADWRGDLPPHGAMVETKIDGWRALWFRGLDGCPRLWTRGGMPIEGTGHIAHRLAMFEEVAGGPLFIDGEFQVGGSLAATKAWCERGYKLGGEVGQFHAFDVLDDVEWRAGGSPTPAYQRKARLQQLAAEVEARGLPWEWREGSRGRDEGVTPVSVLEDRWVATPLEALRLAREVWAGGGEGLMLKDAEAPYQRSRSAAWMKVKAENAAKWSPRFEQGRLAA